MRGRHSVAKSFVNLKYKEVARAAALERKKQSGDLRLRQPAAPVRHRDELRAPQRSPLDGGGRAPDNALGGPAAVAPTLRGVT